MAMLGADYSFSRPDLGGMRRAGVKVVLRYVGPESWGKTLTQAEYDALVADRFVVMAVFEVGATDGMGGLAAGRQNATLALAYLPKGYPAHFPVFMACDQELYGTTLATAAEYVRGAAEVLGPSRTGVYGQGSLLALTRALRHSSWHWLSASTSYPGWADAARWADVIQSAASVPGIPGTDADTVLRLPQTPTPVPGPPTPPSGGVSARPVGALPRLYYGMPPSPWVAFLHAKLGMPRPRWGGFGRITRARVLAVQRKHGGPADGVVGPQTWKWLDVE